MSVPVRLEALGQALIGVGAGYLLTTVDGRVKVVSVDPTIRDGVMTTQPSKGSERNLATNPLVTVVFPPLAHHGFTLIVDGHAVATDDGIEVTPTSAIWHRPARHGDGPAAPPGAGPDSATCGNACHPVTDRPTTT